MDQPKIGKNFNDINELAQFFSDRLFQIEENLNTTLDKLFPKIEKVENKLSEHTHKILNP